LRQGTHVAGSATLRGMRVLVVEDQGLIALALVEALQAAGHHVIGPAASSAVALQLAATESPSIAFVDLDLETPGIGLQLTERLHQEFGVCVVLASGQAELARTSDFALGLLAKPYNPIVAAQSVSLIDAILRNSHLSQPRAPRGMELFARNYLRIRTRAITRRPILLVEDHPRDAELALEALEQTASGGAVVVARDGADALDYLEACAGRVLPSLILLDVKMPRVDGIEVLQRIKATAQWRAIPVVMLTASREENDVRRAYASGANAFVFKPTDFGAFATTLQRLTRFWLQHNRMSSRAYAAH
jgi:CheY-like chemotaxis protein